MAFYQLATRYLTGEASGSERQQLVEQLRKPEARALFEEMRSGWEGSPANLEKGFDVDAIAQRVAIAVAEDQPHSEPDRDASPVPHRPRRIRHRYSPWFFRLSFGVLATSFAALAIVAVIWFRPAPPAKVAGGPVSWVQRSCGASERLLVTLGDGTKITLNSGSILSHPEIFGPYGRVVRLTGEAFFDVSHDESRPFVVETPTLRIRVLGTRFNVRAFADGTKAQVSLVKGKVQVTEIAPRNQEEAKPVVLTPGEQYNFSPETRMAKVQPVSAEAATGWMQDVFVWKREPAASAMRQLERRFGIGVEFSDPALSNEELNGTFEAESLEEIFETLQLTGIFNYRLIRAGDKIERVILSPGQLADFSSGRHKPM
ncbi:Fe2+-dicitrate sensor, membrane component [Opitutaceae bacterium TAV1]|nr:Fe2+-dicitrate sensor, membrane component [Opitutaceae bacterium TAV1]